MKRLSLLAFVLLVMSLTVAGCTRSGDDGKEKIYDVKGKVVAVDVEKKEVTLDHEAIPGLMGAMKMPFQVENTKTLEGLKAGDEVHGRLKVKNGTRTIIELMKH